MRVELLDTERGGIAVFSIICVLIYSFFPFELTMGNNISIVSFGMALVFLFSLMMDQMRRMMERDLNEEV